MTTRRRLVGQTTHCIHCGRPATTWTGWVLDKGGALLAGFCSSRCIRAEDEKAQGLMGTYEPWMGKEAMPL